MDDGAPFLSSIQLSAKLYTIVSKCPVMQVAVIAASCCVGPGQWWW